MAKPVPVVRPRKSSGQNPLAAKLPPHKIGGTQGAGERGTKDDAANQTEERPAAPGDPALAVAVDIPSQPTEVRQYESDANHSG